jgi:hypothetical protein
LYRSKLFIESSVNKDGRGRRKNGTHFGPAWAKRQGRPAARQGKSVLTIKSLHTHLVRMVWQVCKCLLRCGGGRLKRHIDSGIEIGRLEPAVLLFSVTLYQNEKAASSGVPGRGGAIVENTRWSRGVRSIPCIYSETQSPETVMHTQAGSNNGPHNVTGRLPTSTRLARISAPSLQPSLLSSAPQLLGMPTYLLPSRCVRPGICPRKPTPPMPRSHMI